MQSSPNPLVESAAADAEDLDLVRQVQSGSRAALERLIERPIAIIRFTIRRISPARYDASIERPEVRSILELK